ncbi:hypothetical protein ACFPIJ_44285 [Dactylosporangium cerinum]|uniref:Uncharacterized protein n=1 Tax=Dactylosporangium cerinum TaxID=1434730 RepID=A0ABV9WC15_9ACTN
MSSIASLYVLREPDVRTLAESGHAPDDLELRDAFHWSGYFMLYLLLFLEEEQDVPVSRSRYDEVLPDPADGMRFVLTAEHQAHLPRLDVATFDQAAFDDYLDEMGGSFEESPIAVEETLTLLRDQVAALRDDQALVIEIG